MLKGAEIGRYKSHIVGMSLPFKEQKEGQCGMIWDEVKLRVSTEILYIYSK